MRWKASFSLELIIRRWYDNRLRAGYLMGDSAFEDLYTFKSENCPGDRYCYHLDAILRAKESFLSRLRPCVVMAPYRTLIRLDSPFASASLSATHGEVPREISSTKLREAWREWDNPYDEKKAA